MSAAEGMRGGNLTKFQALEDAGINNTVVEMFVFLSATGQKGYAGKSGERHYNRLTIKPNPEVKFSRKMIATENGLENISDVSLKGPFPESLEGFEIVIDSSGAVTASVATSKIYESARAFRLDVEKAEYFLIDGEKYKFRGGGFLDVNKTESEWVLKLVRADK